jgi:hypothetical protein
MRPEDDYEDQSETMGEEVAMACSEIHPVIHMAVLRKIMRSSLYSVP